MTKQFDRLVQLLTELFQLDQPELDFGIYPILHLRSGEIIRFIEKDLLGRIKEAFIDYNTAGRRELEIELSELIDGIKRGGLNPDDSPKVKSLRERIQAEGADAVSLEAETYDHLYRFFRRYYLAGDFLSKRVYKPGVYAVPYEGEELKLHWATKDQYYIKNFEYIRNYAFFIKPTDPKTPMRVRFSIVEDSKANRRPRDASETTDRVFILAREFLKEVNGDLVIAFHFRPATMLDWTASMRRLATPGALTKPPGQKLLTSAAVTKILSERRPSFRRWIDELSKPYQKQNGTATEYTIVEAHLNRYTARNTRDYFIHKDIRSFLRRELDYYIKNEVMRLDDIESETASRVEQYLSKIKAVRSVAHKLIDFLAQIDDFQKTLWLKQKFVTGTHYCIAVGQIPESFYPEITSNQSQYDEWARLLDVKPGKQRSPASSIKIDVLKQHPSLLLDTRYFTREFTDRLLATFSDLSERLDAIVINADNVHALRLLSPLMENSVSMIYVDPPYNTGGDGFMYRDNYRHSTWLSMISERLSVSTRLLRDDGIVFASIDHNERAQLEHALIETFGADNRVEEIVWIQNTTKNQSPTYSTNHEFVEVFARNLSVAKKEFRRFREPKNGLTEVQKLLTEINPKYPSVSEVEQRLSELYRKNKEDVSCWENSSDNPPED